CDDRLFVAETDAGRILVYDLWNRQLLRRMGLVRPSDPHALPLDLAAREDVVWCILDDGDLLRLTARTEPVRVELRRPHAAPSDAKPRRLAVSPGGLLLVLFVDAAGDGWLAPQSGRLRFPDVDRATDVEFLADDLVVVARNPGDDLLTYKIED